MLGRCLREQGEGASMAGVLSVINRGIQITYFLCTDFGGQSSVSLGCHSGEQLSQNGQEK